MAVERDIEQDAKDGEASDEDNIGKVGKLSNDIVGEAKVLTKKGTTIE